MIHQRTIENAISCSGVGIHSGKVVNVTLRPNGPDSGIVFVRTDLKDQDNTIFARYPNFTSKGFSTTITNHNGATVDTIEHIMAALWFLHITNVIIEIDGNEMPILDGSSEYFLFLIEAAGVTLQDYPMKTLDIQKEIIHTDGDKSIIAAPSKGLSIDFYYDFEGNHSLLKDSSFHFSATKSNFKYDIARARTFSPIEQVKYLQEKGLAGGGSKLNALIINGESVENSEKLRYYNEPVRHKILDCVGDFYLSGYHINGYFKCYKSGHKMNLKIIEEIFKDSGNYVINNASL